MIAAVCFDLDDTLFLQSEWLAGAWRAVARAASAAGGPEEEVLVEALEHIAAQGTAAGRIIDRALERVGADRIDPAPLVSAFRTHRAGVLSPLPGVVEGLARLRGRVPIGLISDGDVTVQEAKLADLGLARAFDSVVLSDRLGRSRRKPHPAPFAAALADLGAPAHGVVHVGDHPRKDVEGATAAGWLAVRVRTGEYAAVDGGRPWRDVADVAAAIALIESELVAATAASGGQVR